MTILRAEVANVNMGSFSMEGLMDENKNYYVAVVQLVTLNLIPPNRSAKQLEAVVGKGFQSHVVQFKTDIHPKAINAIPLIYFEEVLFNLAIKGVEPAINLSRQLIGASLTKLFCIAFKQKFDDDDIREYLEARQSGIRTRRNLTNAIDDWHKTNYSDKAPGLLYAIATNKIYQKLYGMDARKLESWLECPRYKSRSVMDKDSLVIIDRAENKVTECIDYEGYDPVTAVDKVKIYPATSLPCRKSA